jgi:hypothetical protein
MSASALRLSTTKQASTRLFGRQNRQESQMLFDLEDIRKDDSHITAEPTTAPIINEWNDFNFIIGKNSYKVNSIVL